MTLVLVITVAIYVAFLSWIPEPTHLLTADWKFRFFPYPIQALLALINSSHLTGYSYDQFPEKLKQCSVIFQNGWRCYLHGLYEMALKLLHETTAPSLFTCLPILALLMPPLCHAHSRTCIFTCFESFPTDFEVKERLFEI